MFISWFQCACKGGMSELSLKPPIVAEHHKVVEFCYQSPNYYGWWAIGLQKRQHSLIIKTTKYY